MFTDTRNAESDPRSARRILTRHMFLSTVSCVGVSYYGTVCDIDCWWYGGRQEMSVTNFIVWRIQRIAGCDKELRKVDKFYYS
jgi:hypothetical protein